MMLHILKKDTRRLWWQILMTLVMLAALAWTDRWRADWIPGPIEGWLNLLLPLAWACLIALVVQEEPLAGNRQFWITRPYRRSTLLAAKVLFVLVFVHLPSFLADIAILGVRGFQPLDHLPQLLWKQVLQAGALVLPALALATLVRNFTHFMMAVFVIAGGIVILTGRFRSFSVPWRSIDEVYHSLTIIVLAVSAVAIVCLQYGPRRLVLSRSLGIVAALVAAILSTYIPATYAFGIRAAFSPIHPELTLRVAPRRAELPHGWTASGRVALAIPVEVSGIPDWSQFRLEQLALEISGSGGERYRTITRSMYRPFDKVSVEAFLLQYPYQQDPGPFWLLLRLDRSVYNRLGTGPVKVTGKAAATFYRLGETSVIPVETNREVSGLGHCFSSIVEGPYSEGMVKVVCESPSEIPLTRITLSSPDGREWKQRLGDSSTFTLYPGDTWLSPLERRQTFFRITENHSAAPGSQWLVPRAVVPTAGISVTPEHVTGYAVLSYEIASLSPSDFVLPLPSR